MGLARLWFDRTAFAGSNPRRVDSNPIRPPSMPLVDWIYRKMVAFRHGLRAVEICDLEWSQLEFGRSASLHVRRVKNGKPSVHPLRGTKSGHSESCPGNSPTVASSLRPSGAGPFTPTPSIVSNGFSVPLVSKGAVPASLALPLTIWSEIIGNIFPQNYPQIVRFAGCHAGAIESCLG
jgi:hypothetical protein